MAKKKEKEVSKIDHAYEMYKQMKAQGELKDKEIYEKIAEEIGISVHSARRYGWRKENPEKYKALLEGYFTREKDAPTTKLEELVQMNENIESRYEEIFGDPLRSYSEKLSRQKDFLRKNHKLERKPK